MKYLLIVLLLLLSILPVLAVGDEEPTPTQEAPESASIAERCGIAREDVLFVQAMATNLAFTHTDEPAAIDALYNLTGEPQAGREQTIVEGTRPVMRMNLLLADGSVLSYFTGAGNGRVLVIMQRDVSQRPEGSQLNDCGVYEVEYDEIIAVLQSIEAGTVHPADET